MRAGTGQPNGRRKWREHAIRAVLALYPRHLRERYGDEVAELLRRSPTPARDLTDVAVCAAAEHGGSISMATLGRSSARVAGLAAIPFAVIILWVAGWVLTNELMQAGLEPWYPVVVVAVPALLAVPVVVWLAVLHRRRSRPARSAFVVPAAFALGLFVIAAIPGPNAMIGERPGGTLVALVVWLAGMLLIGLPRLSLPARAALAFVVLDLAIAGYVLSAFPREVEPLSEAIFRYPLSVIGRGGTTDLTDGLLADDTLQLLPQILTVLTVYILVRTRPVQTVPAY